MERIIRNRIRCRNCGVVIESRTKEEIVTCSCGRVSVAGGHDFLRRVCLDGPKDIEELSEVEHDDEEEDFDAIEKYGSGTEICYSEEAETDQTEKK